MLLDDVADPPAQLDRVDPRDVLAVERMRPVVGSISRLIIFIVVVLPQPDGPTSTASSPAAKVRSSSATPTVPSA